MMQAVEQNGKAGRLIKTSSNTDKMMETQKELHDLRLSILKKIRARYDAAQTTIHNKMHWSESDSLIAARSSNSSVRRILRRRSRYEFHENSPYLQGTIITISGDFVGSGPKLQIVDPRFSKKSQRAIEKRFAAWALAIKLRRKLWQLRFMRMVEGESFLVEIDNERNRDPLTLDYFVLEPELLDSPFEGAQFDTNIIDGIRYDKNLEPIEYFIGDWSAEVRNSINMRKGRWVDAEFVIHWFRRDRPWLRGIPELASSLELCALLRRYTLAVVTAAEYAADFSGFIQSQMPPNMAQWPGQGSDGTADTDFFQFPIDRGLVTFLPDGYDFKQADAKQPSVMYDKFVDALVREIVRPACIPFNLAIGYSGGYNMASGALDRMLYGRGIEQDRMSCDEEVMDPILHRWWFEATRTPGYLPTRAVESEVPEHVWRWDQVEEHVDPTKNAGALVALWEKGFITDRDIQETKFNRDVDRFYEDHQEQTEQRTALGLPLPGAVAGGMEDDEEDDAEDDVDDSKDTNDDDDDSEDEE